MTSTEPALCTSAPKTGLRMPSIARMIAMKFKIIEKLMFTLMVVSMRLESAMR